MVAILILALVAASSAPHAAVAPTSSEVDKATENVPPTATLVAFQQDYHPAVAPASVETSGYAEAGDLGAARYAMVASQPAHSCKLSITTSGGARVWYSLTSDTIRPEMCGPTDHVAADAASAARNSAAIQNAIDYFSGAHNAKFVGANNQGDVSGKVILSSFAIDRTIVLAGGVTLEGTGWGSSLAPSPPQSYLRWVGPAGVPMITVTDWFGAEIDNIRLIGNSAAKPSACINVSNNGSTTTTNTTLRKIWCGGEFGLDRDGAKNQFVNGITFTGVINSDSNHLEMIRIQGCDETGLLVTNPNASSVTLQSSDIIGCETAVRTNATINIVNLYASNRGYNFITETAGKIYLWNYAGEQGRLYRNAGSSTKFVVHDSAFQLYAPTIPDDGVILDVGSGIYWDVELYNLKLQFNRDHDEPPRIKLKLHDGRNNRYGNVRIINSDGIWPANLDLGKAVWANDTMAPVVYEPPMGTAQDAVPSQHVILDWNAASWGFNVFQTGRNDYAGMQDIIGGPLIVRKLAAPINGACAAATGGGASSYFYRVTAVDGMGNESLPSAEFSCENAALGAAASNKVTWSQVVGAWSYRVYGRKKGSERFLATITWDMTHGAQGVRAQPPGLYLDDGSAAGGRGLPETNATANAIVEGMITTGGIRGAAGGSNALPGAVGEYVSSSVARADMKSLVSKTPADVTSVLLSAGDWDCAGNVTFGQSSSTFATSEAAWISTTSKAEPAAPNGGGYASVETTPRAGAAGGTLNLGNYRVNLSAPAQVYLGAMASFSDSGSAAYGFIGCRRMR